MAKILVVEDDPLVAQSIATLLTSNRHTVESVADGGQALALLRVYNYDLIVLDLWIPGLTGEELCAKYRANGGQTPILMLTGKRRLTDKVAGLDSGADDYLVKPFNAEELSARVRALLRRESSEKTNELVSGELRLNLKTKTVHVQDGEVQLLAKELAVLEFLLRHKGQVFSAETILDRVWSSESDSTLDAIRQCIARLRKKIDKPGRPSMITTVIGLGYTIK
jgi:DNA-binding response OmpR family regulator